MKFLNALKKWVLLITFIAATVWVFGFNWSFVFKKRVVGEVVAAEKVNNALTVITNSQDPVNPQVFSFSIGIQDAKTGEIYMASSEDRQWAAVTKGNCVVAAYFPYPPWMLAKANTSHNARLLRNFTTCAQMPDQDGVLEWLRFFFLFS